MKKLLAATIVGLFLSACSGNVSTETPATIEDGETDVQTDVRVFSPRPNGIVSLPLQISGEARGYWYFEANFSLEILDEGGTRLAEIPIQADGDWMTVEFVPFSVTIENLNWGDSLSGSIVFHKANASGLPENDESFTVPIRFQ